MLPIQIPVTRSAISVIKARLRRALPEVKSSHRVEAAARAFGFSTYASMRAAADAGNHSSSEVSGSAFSAYLMRHGFGTEPIAIYRAAACVCVSAVLQNEPRLSMRGFGFAAPDWNYQERRWDTSRECYAKFVEHRREFDADESLDEFIRAHQFMLRIPKTKTVRSGTGSYRLKHIAERMPLVCSDGTTLGPDYVSNGALIAAALHTGFRTKTYVDERGYDFINVNFNMPKRVVDDLDCEFRPDGGFAQDRARLAERRNVPKYRRIV